MEIFNRPFQNARDEKFFCNKNHHVIFLSTYGIVSEEPHSDLNKVLLSGLQIRPLHTDLNLKIAERSTYQNQHNLDELMRL